MVKTYCWLSNAALEYCKDILIKNGIAPICADMGIAYDIDCEIRKDSEDKNTIFEKHFAPDAQTVYWDEPYTTNDIDVHNYISDHQNSLITGDTCFRFMDKLIADGVQNITYTAYREHLFRITLPKWLFGGGLNIVTWRNQIPTWEKMKTKYGSKFNYCWIHIEQIDDYPRLIKWCRDNSKKIMLCGDDKISPGKSMWYLSSFVRMLE